MPFLYQLTHNKYETECFDKEIEIISKIRDKLMGCGLVEVGDFKTSGLLFYVNENKKIIVAVRLVNSIKRSIDFINSIKFNGFKKILITDNVVKSKLKNIEVINLSPYFFGIYSTTYKFKKLEIHKKFSVLMHRSTHARQMVFYKLIENKLLDKCYCSYNVFNHNNTSPTDEFNNISNELLSTFGNKFPLNVHESALQLIPYNNFGDEYPYDIQYNTDISLIVESFPFDKDITFSEKIFRSLQTPRLWVLYSVPKSVEYLSSLGFDTFGDYIDHHRYDCVFDSYDRLNAIMGIMNELKDTVLTPHDINDITKRSKKNIRLLKRLNTGNFLNNILIKIAKAIH